MYRGLLGAAVGSAKSQDLDFELMMMKRRPIDTSASRLTSGVRLCPAENTVGCVGMTRKAKKSEGQKKRME